MITSLGIKNFRGIQNLEIANLAKFNIFIGKNGTGKTSILEAVSLAASGRKKREFFEVLNERSHYSAHENDVINSIFPHITKVTEHSDDKPTVQINFEGDKPRQPSGIYQFTFYSITQTESFKFSTGESVDSAYEIAYSHPLSDSAGNSTHKLKAFTGGGKINFGDTSDCDICLSSAFIPFGISATKETLELLNSILSSKSKHSDFISKLRHANEQLEGLSSHSNSVRAFLKNSDSSYPISTLGSGFCRLFEIFVKASTNPNLIAIDEIDSGLHHSVMENTWKMLIKTLAEQHTQLFCTTHSEELLTKTLSAFSDHQEDLAIFRLETTKSGNLQAVRIGYESLKYQKTEILTGSEHVS